MHIHFSYTFSTTYPHCVNMMSCSINYTHQHNWYRSSWVKFRVECRVASYWQAIYQYYPVYVKTEYYSSRGTSLYINVFKLFLNSKLFWYVAGIYWDTLIVVVYHCITDWDSIEVNIEKKHRILLICLNEKLFNSFSVYQSFLFQLLNKKFNLCVSR